MFFGIALCISFTIMANSLGFTFVSSKFLFCFYIYYSNQKFFPMFRGLSLFLLYFWLLACNVRIWNICHINYK